MTQMMQLATNKLFALQKLCDCPIYVKDTDQDIL